jgi:hypothetical protein
MTAPNFGTSTQEGFHRARSAYEMSKRGLTRKEIGDLLGVSRSRAGQLVKKGGRLSKINVWWDDELPWALGEKLNKLGITSKQALAEAFESRQLCFTPREDPVTRGGLGKHALTLVCQWMGVDPDQLTDDPISAREFAIAVQSGKSFHDAVLDHLAGGGGAKMAVVMRVLKGVAALNAKEQSRLLEWAKNENTGE